MKRFTGIILTIAIMLMCTTPAFAATKYEYLSSTDWAEGQGTNNWYYMYSTAKVMGTYKEMAWGEWSNIWKTCYAYSVADGKASTYIADAGLQKPNLGSSVAKVWEAPMTGIVQLTSEGGIKKNESQTAGCTIAAKIYKADANQENAVLLWETEIAGTDNVGVNYNLDVEIKRGERLFFEVMCVSTDAYGECRWDPKVTYNQAVSFSSNGEIIDSISGVAESDTITCTFYDKDTIEEDMFAYLALYNKDGGMVNMASQRINVADWNTREVELSVPMLGGVESFEGWSADILLLTAENGRCYSVLNGAPFSIK